MTYRLTDDDRSKITATMPMGSAGWRVLRYPVETFAAVEAIIAPIHARAEAAEKRADDLAAVIDRIRELRDEWETYGADLYRNPYSGGDVHEAQTLATCATDIAALLPDDTKEADR